MKQKTLNLSGSIPSKKNSRNLFVRGGRIVNIPSNKYLDWHSYASEQIAAQKFYFNCNVGRVRSIHIEFFFNTNHRTDLTNKAESVLDLLVDCHIISDDCWQEVPQVILISSGIDKKNPGCKITITHEE